MTEDKFEGCILAGAIGDAWGSSYESEKKVDESKTFFWGERPKIFRSWHITDDTQLTLATCEVLAEESYSVKKLADKLVKYYQSRRINGIGSSTLKAILELEAGQHWLQSGRKGEYAAGNGAAMRIAPFAFFKNRTTQDVHDACRVTHNNDEAYSGALAVYFSIKTIINNPEIQAESILGKIIAELPDTNVRDRLIEISQLPLATTITDVSKLGNNGYVVNSIPFAIFSATKVSSIGLKDMFRQIIDSGGDTDTNASIAGQIAGAIIGRANIPEDLLSKLRLLPDFNWMEDIVKRTKAKLF